MIRMVRRDRAATAGKPPDSERTLRVDHGRNPAVRDGGAPALFRGVVLDGSGGASVRDGVRWAAGGRAGRGRAGRAQEASKAANSSGGSSDPGIGSTKLMVYSLTISAIYALLFFL